MTVGTTLILDPSVVVPDEDINLLDFWEEFVEWTSDDRISLGQLSHEFIVAWCSSTIWAGDSTLIPVHLIRDISVRINSLLTRQPVEHEALLSSPQTTPKHLSSLQGLSDSFVSDIVGLAAGRGVDGIASNPRYWSDFSDIVEVLDSGAEVEILYSSQDQLRSDLREEVFRFYSGKKIIIVGGKKSATVLKNMTHKCGIVADQVEWIESEPHKVPRELSARLKSFDGKSGDLVLIYGKVGHASFEHVQMAAQRCGYLLIQPQYESQIVDKLCERALGIPASD